ncbi:MAG: hypothetical protein HKN27_07160 [Silicimonas sp.]|nr:hypothetical protein [Silicimonas sp.]
MEGIKIISLLVALGALFWAGMSFISGSPEFGNTSFDVSGNVGTAGLVFAIAVVVNIIAGRLQKKL